MHKIKYTQGFTLIEILVASVILFSSIAAVSLIYRGAYLSSEKANSHMLISGLLPIVISNIREDIRGQGNEEGAELNGKGSSFEVSYQWKAILLDYKAPPKFFDVDSGKVIESAKKYKLWQVELVMNDDVSTSKYFFKELSWNDK